MLAEKIDMYIKERVTLADEVIVAFGKEKIKDGSVVLTYARSVPCFTCPRRQPAWRRALICSDLFCSGPSQELHRREAARLSLPLDEEDRPELLRHPDRLVAAV